MKRVREKRINSFTLTEMCIVLAMLGILALFISLRLFNSIEEANVTKAVQDIYNIASAGRRHYSDTGAWPAWPHTPAASDYGRSFVTNDDNLAHWEGPYLESWPDHPWSRVSINEKTYQWDDQDVDGDGTNELVVEIGLNDLTQVRRNSIARMIDRAIDRGDGACAGKFRNFPAQCPDWEGWPKYVVYDPDEV